MNSYRGGPYQQAISGVTYLNNAWYDGNAYQTYAFEYRPGGAADGGYIAWLVGGRPSWTLDARAIGANGNVGPRLVPQEPLAMVVNFGMSDSFAAINTSGIAATLPATLRVDYVRVYQDPSVAHAVTCDPPGFPTTPYIARHARPYRDPNVTSWADAGYSWPRNSLVHGC